MDLLQQLQILQPLVESLIADLEIDRRMPAVPESATSPEPDYSMDWRERIWTAPAETRLGAEEVCEAFHKPKSWLYRHTSAKTIPFRRLDGSLCFVVGELRAWAREHEEVVASGPMESAPAERNPLRSIS